LIAFEENIMRITFFEAKTSTSMSNSRGKDFRVATTASKQGRRSGKAEIRAVTTSCTANPRLE